MFSPFASLCWSGGLGPRFALVMVDLRLFVCPWLRLPWILPIPRHTTKCFQWCSMLMSSKAYVFPTVFRLMQWSSPPLPLDLRDLPEWLEDFTENLVDEGVSASRDIPASTSRGPQPTPPRKVVSGKHNFSRPEGPKLRSMQEDQDHKGSSQETHWYLITADHKFLSEECDSRAVGKAESHAY